ncbi:MAG: single-stranded DNA-binding protein [Bacteroidales bacterium]|jgi:single-strand DNA-binding protein|nr:single-stranded DNA-binding protein [Bacteroidales bacterium]MDP3399283.1 single-stranded DNA-binding protein [Bacteroidales bacterium]
MSLNKVMLIGNVGKDPDIRHLASNSSVARFPLATSEKFKTKSGDLQEQTEWHNIVCWRSLSDLAEKYIHKGSKLYIEGRIRTNSWNDKNTGEKKYATEIFADSIVLLDRAGDDRRGPDREQAPSSPKAEDIMNAGNNNLADMPDTDDLPF